MPALEVNALVREITGDGPEDAKIVVLTDCPTYSDKPAGRSLSDYVGKLLFSEFLKAGITRSRVRVESICQRIPPNRKLYLLDQEERNAWNADCLERLGKFRPNVLVPLGEDALRLVTDKTSIQKWHLSIFEGFQGIKTIPLLHPEYILKIFKEIPFLTFGAMRVAEESQYSEIPTIKRNFIINPSVDESLAWIRNAILTARELSLDIETASGQITCIGFSTHPKEAICIATQAKDYSPEAFHRLWTGIQQLLNSPLEKIGQNLIYDTTYLSKYGIRTRNIRHDTMVCQKFLHPELPMGLDTIARLYTKEPYWKDEGKDWGLRQDINQLYYYNCKDSACTLEASHGQSVDLIRRGLEKLFYEKQMSWTPPAMQMSWSGLPIDQTERGTLIDSTKTEIQKLESELNSVSREKLGEEINPRSHQAVKRLLVAYGYRVPTERGKETSNKAALLKLRLKDPESRILTPLIQISEANKRLSSFLEYDFDSDNRVRYTLYNHGTESARWSSGLDPWGKGFNSQTIPSELKSQFTSVDPMIEIDLKQAESRFVAWDGPVPKLQQMFRDGTDIHRFVASHPLMFNKPMEQITNDERQLGKKAGHASNYGMSAPTLSNQCLVEMDLVLSVNKAQRMLDGYHAAMEGGILRWQQKIRDEVTRTKKLKTPLGYERIFYDRICPELFKEAYAYRPQNTVVTVINFLMGHLYGRPGVLLLNQVHDSLLLAVKPDRISETMELIKDQDAWNPRMQLSGGELRIPIEVKYGHNLKKMEKVFEG